MLPSSESLFGECDHRLTNGAVYHDVLAHDVTLNLCYQIEWHGVIFVHSGPFKDGVFRFTMFIPDG